MLEQGEQLSRDCFGAVPLAMTGGVHLGQVV